MATKQLKHIVVSFFIGFLLSAAVAIVLAYNLDKKREAEIATITVEKETKLSASLRLGQAKVDSLYAEYTQFSDSIVSVVAEQESHIVKLQNDGLRLSRTLKSLQATVAENKSFRDSLLHNIKIE